MTIRELYNELVSFKPIINLCVDDPIVYTDRDWFQRINGFLVTNDIFDKDNGLQVLYIDYNKNNQNEETRYSDLLNWLEIVLEEHGDDRLLLIHRSVCRVLSEDDELMGFISLE